MKRDMDKVRNILLALEERQKPYFMMMNPELIGGIQSTGEMVEYILMLRSGGLLDEQGGQTYRISWRGHEFLDSVRDPEIWSKTKEGVAKVGAFSFGMIAEIAIGYAKAKAASLGLPMI
ncbi:DUF2513 domain-containing protein [Sphingobium sp. UBA5915]|uniref:DUF2513 domain-containing protein n=1 Tax=Sphingobium sp. UBA5915 TaxID=1947530 RepID=UPI0025EC7377|nr:DUF2513 domain-containing protein [Sphingobium sp. UBA5915]